MKKFIVLLALPILASCGSSKEIVSMNPEGYPVYCVRGVEEHKDEGYALIDMPGFYHGRDDKPIKVTWDYYMDTYVNMTREGVPFCAPEDPRMK